MPDGVLVWGDATRGGSCWSVLVKHHLQSPELQRFGSQPKSPGSASNESRIWDAVAINFLYSIQVWSTAGAKDVHIYLYLAQ